MRYDLTDLRLFAAVADAGNVSKGGASCFLAPSSASLRIKQLEESLGTQLFKREARGVSLTAAGRVMLDHCRQVLAGLEQMHADLAPYAQGIKAHVTLFANSSAIASFVPKDLRGFLNAHPEVRVTMEDRLSRETIEAVLSARADIGIVTWDDDHPDLIFLPYRMNELLIVVPEGDPLAQQHSATFAECLKRPFVAMNSSTAFSAYLSGKAASLGRHIDVRIQVNSFASVLSLIRAGAGVGVIPRPVLQSLNCEGVHLLPLHESWAIRPLRICKRREDRHLTPYAEALLDALLTASARDESPDAAGG